MWVNEDVTVTLYIFIIYTYILVLDAYRLIGIVGGWHGCHGDDKTRSRLTQFVNSDVSKCYIVSRKATCICIPVMICAHSPKDHSKGGLFSDIV
ncbi:hypothetical protein PV327_004696 [Microctonus hyperodae]|uniref:Uncharacterized protein n=1 Tax=Microctonus hyperodae TaxID=165561 RepID=A0AA39KMV4_MICHY|nr:hypothetical protein PV327_004696 [Microctonus hyperodae]